MTSSDPLTLAQNLIGHASVSGEPDPGALDAIEAILRPLGFSFLRQVFDLPQGSYPVDNLYAHLGTKGPNLCFAGHTDVVPVGDQAAWTHPPFAAEVHDGILYGRGTVDMKGAIACWMAALINTVQRHQGPLPCSFSLLITGDEEHEAVGGTKPMLQWLSEQGHRLDLCIVGEPTNPTKLGEMIKIGRRGSISFTLTLRGTQGHVAYPDVAHNPVTDLVSILHHFKAAPLDQGTEFFPPSNLEITSIDVGNTATNMIPASATAMGNIRFNPTHSLQSLEAWLKEQCEALAPGKWQLEIEPSASEAFLTPPGALSTLAAEAVEEVCGTKPALTTTGGTSDARFIKNHCPVVECGLINATAHKVDEHVPVEALHQLTAIYERIIEGFIKSVPKPA